MARRGRALLDILFFILCLAFAPNVRADDSVSAVVALVDFNPVLGDEPGNIQKIVALATTAIQDGGADIVVFPEQATTGFSITKAQATKLALQYPFPELAKLTTLAKLNNAYIVLGIVELWGDGITLFNSAIIIQPNGQINIQRKRLAASAAFGWNSRGNTPFDVYPSPFGDIAVLICADSFLMDWMRIATLKGADIVLLPANWWGWNRQLELWRARASQNGVWLLAANRWGSEPNLFPPPSNYYMNNGPSAAVDLTGLPVLSYEADDVATPADTILYQTVIVPQSRIGGANPTFTVANRRPSAYQALKNAYYVPPQNNPVPNLPPPGAQPVQLLAYAPTADPAANLNSVTATLKLMPVAPGALVVLPGLGLTPQPIDPISNPGWYADAYWRNVSALVRQMNAQGLVTSVLLKPAGANRASLAVVFVGPTSTNLYPQIHDSGDLAGSGKPPPIIMLNNAAITVMTGIDSLFPEIGVQAAKSGADIAVIVSAIGGKGDQAVDAAGIGESLPLGWDIDDLARQWQTMANGCMHVLGADASGYSFAANQGSYCTQGQSSLAAFAPVSLSLDTGTQRKKLLNWYYTFDLETLLGP